MEDRPRPLPTLTTSTDFTNSNYNSPVGPEPLPKTFPPRQRSHHLRNSIAAQRLRDEYDKKLAAQGLERAQFPAVSVLGLEGTSIALTVERALAGEPLEAVSGGYQEQQPAAGGGGGRGNKRKRQSSTTTGGGGGGGKGRSNSHSIHVPQEQPTMQYLPNPFASAGAVPEGSTMARNSTEALAAAQAAAAAEIQQQLQQNPYEIPVVPTTTTAAGVTPGLGEYEMEEGGGSGGSQGGFGTEGDEEEEDYKPNIAGGGTRRGGRQSTGGPEKAARSKRSKGSVLTPGVHSIPYVPRNPDGTPRLPLAAGIMTLNSLGGESQIASSLSAVVTPKLNRRDPLVVVNNQEGFHTERYIFPVGYEAIR